MHEPLEPSESHDLNLFEILGFLHKHLKTLLVFLSLGILFGLGFWFITPPQYRASTKLKLSHNGRDVIGFGQEFYWNPYRDEFFKTEFQIIRSLAVAERVVDQVGFAALQNQTNEQDNSKQIEDLAMQAKTDQEPVDHSREARRQKFARSLLNGVSVAEIKGTNLVQISYVSGDPNQAKMLAQAWAEAYIANDIDNNYQKNFVAYNFLTTKADELREKIDKIVQAVAQDDKTKEIVSISKTSNMDDETLTRLNEAKLSAETRLVEAQNAFQRTMTTQLDQNPEINQSQSVKDLMSEIIQLKTQYQTDLKTYKPGLPRMVALRNQIESKEKSLETERKRQLDSILATKRADIAAAEKEADRTKEAFENERRKQSQTRLFAESEAETLQSQLKVMKHQLEVLEYKKEEMDLAMSLKDLGRSDKVIIEDAAMPGGPISPSLKRYTVFGAMGGLALAIALIFLLEVTDRKIHNSETLEKLSGLPTLATIPRALELDKSLDSMEMRKQVAFFTHLKPTSPFAETYRHLRTNILLSKTGVNKVFLVTSSVSGEGKTISSSNLAIALAQLDKKVLLVDCDLRRPKLHKLFNLPNKIGLVNYLISSDLVRIKGTATQVPNLFLLSSGPLPPNPAELVSAPRMAELVGQLKLDFDYIVIDSSPILAVTDACVLGHLADTVIFVAKASTTLRDDYVRSMHMLASNSIRPLGTILNDFDYSKGRRYYGYKYGYGKYGRSYGYSAYDYQAEEV
ncbi:MAG: polysaccharide biosynthesis tyrosine autokinase [Acidobacteria bacterium]|nr:polysaccharide biosynthesis tyrosine autokinase [Acidobacteriota bacterium]